MVALLMSGKYIVFSSQNCLLAYDILSGKKVDLEVPKIIVEAEKTKGCAKSGSDQILSTAFSSSGKYFAASDDDKTLTVWHVNDSWKLISTRLLPRRSTAITFDDAELNVLVADKSGDVHCFPVLSANENEIADTLVMGHVSMLLDLKLCGIDKFLVTCDRDEKIRVSHYPNAYNIQAFCLGHTDFVSQLLYLEDLDLIASGSGDGTVKLWSYRTGAQISSVDCMSYISDMHALVPQRKCQGTGPVAETCCRGVDVKCLVYCEQLKLIAVALEGHSVILFFKINIDEEEMVLSFTHRTLTSGPVWAICMDNANKLITLQESKGAMVVIYSLDKNEGHLQVTQLNDGASCTGLSRIVEQVNQETEFYKSSVAVQSKFPALHKVRIDNMKEYISRKQERLHQEQDTKNRQRKEITSPNNKSPSEEDTTEGNIKKKIRLNKN